MRGLFEAISQSDDGGSREAQWPRGERIVDFRHHIMVSKMSLILGFVNCARDDARSMMQDALCVMRVCWLCVSTIKHDWGWNRLGEFIGVSKSEK